MADTNLFRRIQKLLRQVLVRKETGTHETSSDTHGTPSPWSLLLSLPSEMILNITDFLDQESRVLLSLTCKALRNLLSSHLNLSLSDVATRTKFLQILERELPNYLTCRACGWMFLWRKRVRWFHCSCPRARDHLAEHWWAHAYVPICPLHCMMVTPEMVDLVRRAYHRGPQHGLPFSFMDSNHKGRYSKTLQTQARMVNGDLMLVSRSTVDMEIDEETTRSSHYLEQAICIHRLPSIVSSLWRAIAAKARSTDCTVSTLR